MAKGDPSGAGQLAGVNFNPQQQNMGVLSTFRGGNQLGNQGGGLNNAPPWMNDWWKGNGGIQPSPNVYRNMMSNFAPAIGNTIGPSIGSRFMPPTGPKATPYGNDFGNRNMMNNGNQMMRGSIGQGGVGQGGNFQGGGGMNRRIMYG